MFELAGEIIDFCIRYILLMSCFLIGALGIGVGAIPFVEGEIMLGIFLFPISLGLILGCIALFMVVLTWKEL